MPAVPRGDRSDTESYSSSTASAFRRGSASLDHSSHQVEPPDKALLGLPCCGLQQVVDPLTGPGQDALRRSLAAREQSFLAAGYGWPSGNGFLAPETIDAASFGLHRVRCGAPGAWAHRENHRELFSVAPATLRRLSVRMDQLNGKPSPSANQIFTSETYFPWMALNSKTERRTTCAEQISALRLNPPSKPSPRPLHHSQKTRNRHCGTQGLNFDANACSYGCSTVRLRKSNGIRGHDENLVYKVRILAQASHQFSTALSTGVAFPLFCNHLKRCN